MYYPLIGSQRPLKIIIKIQMLPRLQKFLRKELKQEEEFNKKKEEEEAATAKYQTELSGLYR